MNIVSKPHMRHNSRFVSSDSKKAADRAAKAETNYAGVEIPKKNVIRLHETFVDGRLPSAESLKVGIIDFFREHKRLPSQLFLTGRSITSIICIACPEIMEPGEWPIVALRIKQGEFLELK